jgi:hypothetical protein
MEYLDVTNWRKVQTYRKDRGTPPWIKVKRALLTNCKWAKLTDAQKGQLVSIWLIAADRDGKVPANPLILRKVCGLDDEPPVDLFIDLGFLSGSHDDNQVTTRCPSGDGQVTSAETETETDQRQRQRKEGARKKKTTIPQAGRPFFEWCDEAGVFLQALDWLDVLRRKKASMTELAWRRRLIKLQRLAENEPAQIILERSADRGWSDLYERNQRRRPHGTHETAVQRRQREAREALGN